MADKHEYIYKWRQNVVNRDDYVDAVLGLWELDYRAHDRYRPNVEAGGYQIIVFVDQPERYYLRSMNSEHVLPDGGHDYTRTSCMPVPFRSLHKAKLAVEMLVASAVDQGEPQ